MDTMAASGTGHATAGGGRAGVPQSIPYGTQPPGSRFVRRDAGDNIVFLMAPYPVSLFSRGMPAWVLRRYWRRPLPASLPLVGMLAWSVIAVGWTPCERLLTVVAAVLLLITYDYGRSWLYWRSGLLVRVEPSQLVVRCIRPWGARVRSWPRGQVAGIAHRDGDIYILRANRRCIGTIRGARPADMGWLAAALRVELGLG